VLTHTLARPIFDTVAEKPFPAVYPEPSGVRGAWTGRAIFLDALDDDTIAIIERRLAISSSGEALAHFRILGGAASRVPADATAYGWRDRTILLWIMTPFSDFRPSEAERHERVDGRFPR
jgi:hypothetical protein